MRKLLLTIVLGLILVPAAAAGNGDQVGQHGHNDAVKSKTTFKIVSRSKTPPCVGVCTFNSLDPGGGGGGGCAGADMGVHNGDWAGGYGFDGHADWCWDGGGGVYWSDFGAGPWQDGSDQIENFSTWGGGSDYHVQESYGIVFPLIGRIGGGSADWDVHLGAGWGCVC